MKEDKNYSQENPDEALCYDILINQNRKNKYKRKLRDAAEAAEKKKNQEARAKQDEVD